MSKRYPGVFARKGRLYIKVKTQEGKWEQRATGLPIGQEALASRVRAALMSPDIVSPDEVDEHTVNTYSRVWLERRRERGRVIHHQVGHFKHHILPTLGEVKLTEVRPRHVRRLIEDLQRQGVKGTRTQGTLAHRTVKHVYSTLRSMFADALVDELVEASPCVLQSHHLPPDQDKDPTWRSRAVFSRAEIVQLISDERIPEVRRVLWAMLALGGPRASSCVVRRWRDIDLNAKPLGRLMLGTKWRHDRKREVEGTKSGIPIEVPIHPLLAQMLFVWRQRWHLMLGHQPGPDDLVVPTERNHVRRPNNLWQSLQRDLDMLGLRRRGVHVLRASFVTHARADGARSDILKMVSHGPNRREIVDVYTRLPWDVLCAEVAKLKLPIAETATTIWCTTLPRGAA